MLTQFILKEKLTPTCVELMLTVNLRLMAVVHVGSETS